jgi:hypothetical protein
MDQTSVEEVLLNAEGFIVSESIFMGIDHKTLSIIIKDMKVINFK